MSETSKIQKVLIVDDEPDLLSVLGELFALFGYEVLRAENGEKAWAKLRANDIDVVLTDVRMPVLDGLDLVRKIRARDRFRPIVMMTSGYTDHMPENLYEAGANGFLSKPFGASGVRDAFVQASVPPERRWAHPRLAGEHLRFERSEIDFEVPGRISLGTGGMFWSCADAPPRVGQLVDFRVSAPDGRWNGQGIVRWSRGPQSERPAACGIEFIYLDDTCRPDVIRRIEAGGRAAFIPCS